MQNQTEIQQQINQELRMHRKLVKKLQNDTLMMYFAGLCILIICAYLNISYENYNDKLHNLACIKIPAEYKNIDADICIFHNKSIINANDMQNIMVIKQLTGEIITNATLKCAFEFGPDFVPNYSYCQDVIEFIKQTPDTRVSSQSAATSQEKHITTHPAQKPSINRQMACKYVEYVNSYINHDFIYHLCTKSNGWNNCIIIMWIVLIFGYILICMNHYEGLIIDNTVKFKLNTPSECIISLEPILTGQEYYRCTRCVAIYKFENFYKYWVSKKKCAYCSVPISAPIKYINS